MNAIKLQLNLEALNALFPEGSEARLDLQRNVVANMLERLALKDVKLLMDGAEQQAKKAVTETLSAMGVGVRWPASGYGVVIDDRVKGAIKGQVLEQVQELIREEIRVAQAGASKDIEERAQYAVDSVIQNKTRHGLRDMIKDQLRDVLKGV
ncbi:hypothetical protein D9M72_161740 [compost metagenome]